jgi:ribosomal protein S18 acetylase RimI-like enzyme
MSTQARFSVRLFRWDDLPAVLDVINTVSAAFNDLRRWTLDEIRFNFEDDYVHPETDYFVAECDGRVVALIQTDYEQDDPQAHEGWGYCYVLPEYRHLGIGARLFELAEARLTEQVPPDTHIGVTFLRVVDGADTHGIALLERGGYQFTRSFYTMMIDLDSAPPAVPLPDGFTLRPVDGDAHIRDIFQTHSDAFQDHWGNHHWEFEDWRREFLERPGVNLGLWQIGWSGDEIAGVSLCRPFTAHPGLAWLSTLAVRRAYRRQGLGDALLRQTFAACKAHGFTRMGLGVDADSLTNAVELYKRGGMHIQHRRDVYQRIVRTPTPILVDEVV